MSYCVIVLLEHVALVEFMAEAPCKKRITFGVIVHCWRYIREGPPCCQSPSSWSTWKILQEPDD